MLEDIDASRLDTWLPGQAPAIRERITNRLAAWGLRDNTKNLPGSGVKPMIWDRVGDGTLALFSDHDQYFCTGRVIGKGRSEVASSELWDSPEFRWLILLTDIQDSAIPLDVIREGGGFSPSYKLNRQALVPKARREAALWAAIAPHLGGRISLAMSTAVPAVTEVPARREHDATKAFGGEAFEVVVIAPEASVAETFDWQSSCSGAQRAL